MRRWLGTIAGAFAFVLVLSAAVGAVAWRFLPAPKDFQVFATAFGDVAGSVFSALAFAGLIVTALMQREELSLQREELRQTRAELKRTAEAQEGSEAALQAQVETASLTARLNAATALLEHYRSIRIDRPSGLDDSDLAHYVKREGEKSRNIKDVLDEIISVRNGLITVTATAELRDTVTDALEGTASTSASAIQEG